MGKSECEGLISAHFCSIELYTFLFLYLRVLRDLLPTHSYYNLTMNGTVAESSFGDIDGTVIGEPSSAPQVTKLSTFPEGEPSAKASSSRHDTRWTGKKPNRVSEFMMPMHTPEENRPFFVRIDRGGVIAALEELDRQLQQVCKENWKGFGGSDYGPQAGRTRLLSKKIPTDWTGVEIAPGQIGLINHG